MQLSQEYQIGTYTEVILGLPMETVESWRDGLTELLELGQHQSIDMWMAQLLEGSEMATTESRRKYGLKSIWVEDYLNLDQTNNHVNDVREFTEIINETNTMSTDEMVDCYMYTWMIIQIHITGYSQLVARYARTIASMPYRVFYDKFYSLVQHHPAFAKHFADLKEIVKNYFYTGMLPDGVSGGHALHTQSYRFLYENRLHVIDVCKSILNLSSELQLLQQKFIFDSSNLDPTEVETNFNLFTGAYEYTKYQIQPQTHELAEDFYTVRRKGLLKNLVTT